MTNIEMLLVICPLIFLAAFVDSIAGGGGLISLPAYLFTGMPTHMAYGSNKFSACIGCFFSVYRFLKSGTVYLKVAILSAIFALCGSGLGAKLALILSDQMLRISMTILLPVAAIFIIFKKKTEEDVNRIEELSHVAVILLSAAIGFVIGMYDGFFGPGAGTFMLLAYTTLMKFDFRTACGNARVVNLASNFAALVVYMLAGQVMYKIAIPATACSILGYWVGSGLAINKGAKYIKPVMICVITGLFIKIIWDMVM